MDVKDVNSKVESNNQISQSGSQKSNLSSISALSVSAPAISDRISLRASAPHSGAGKLRKGLNEIINHTNVAEETTNRLGDLVESIGGIAEQVNSENISPERRSALEKEGNQLLHEIRRAAQTSSDGGIRPLAGDAIGVEGDSIRVEIEERIGRVLDAVLPDDAVESFGIKELDFSTKESIINTVTQIKEAEAQLEKLRNSVYEMTRDVRNAVSSVEIALQNTEAAETSVRDVDEALRLANEARQGIGANPESALQSVGDLGEEKAIGLLK